MIYNMHKSLILIFSLWLGLPAVAQTSLYKCDISMNMIGDIIGHTGETGSACSEKSAGPHLHLEVYENGILVNPEKYIYTQFDEKGNIISLDCYGKMKKYETF